jgi:hypothetical protein
MVPTALTVITARCSGDPGGGMRWQSVFSSGSKPVDLRRLTLVMVSLLFIGATCCTLRSARQCWRAWG